MKKDIFKALMISVLVLSLVFTLLACVVKDNFTPMENLSCRSEQDGAGNGEYDPEKTAALSAAADRYSLVSSYIGFINIIK